MPGMRINYDKKTCCMPGMRINYDIKRPVVCQVWE